MVVFEDNSVNFEIGRFSPSILEHDTAIYRSEISSQRQPSTPTRFRWRSSWRQSTPLSHAICYRDGHPEGLNIWLPAGRSKHGGKICGNESYKAD